MSEVALYNALAESHAALAAEHERVLADKARLESELREAQQLLAGREELRQQAERALSAERTARRVMREALEGALPWLERYAPTMADNARAALAAEPGEGPAAGVVERDYSVEEWDKFRHGLHLCSPRCWCRAAAATKTIDAMLFILERAIADLRRAAAPGSLIPAAPEVKE